MLLTEFKPGETVLEARGITKRFPGVLANDHIDFTIKAGEIHAILGENGAGKTTLMKILFGQYQPDEGEIYLVGQQVVFKSPIDAIEQGIGMVHQHRQLIAAHSVIENIILGHPSASGIIDLKKITHELDELCDRYGFSVDLHAKVWHLSEGEKQVVEILKALYRGAEVLIMDEPTSALTPIETDKLLSSIEAMAEDNLAIVPFITHKLPIVLRISDRITVLRRGKVVSCIDTADATESSLAQELVGREFIFATERTKVEKGETILQVDNLSALNDQGTKALDQASFSISEGEIFGVAGVSGNGQGELVEVLAGLRNVEQGSILLDGLDISKATCFERWRRGVGYIPADRNGVGSIGDFSLVENTAMNYYYDPDFYQRGAMDYSKLRELTKAFIAEYSVAAPGPEVKAKHLSGGNLQKMILARVLSRKPRLIIADLPTQGLDIGATEFVRNKLIEAKKHKAGVLLISEDLDEILAVSDWVAPIYEGRIMGIIPVEEARRERIGAMMAGIEHAGENT
jgi:simple sugar transport system ATP-binding protein